ncbi:MAG: amidohydrolase [Cellulomonadaceae bacterium]|jgi:amidohydrolase|nr:amidohydrolase [Cellulomonadaceae bacterium]
MPISDHLLQRIRESVANLNGDLIALRRDLHAHPEVSLQEVRTTAVIAEVLRTAGLEPVLLEGTGLYCDLGPGDGPRLGMRADLDALPVPELTDLPWKSTVDGVAHACGHDVHTTILVGTALVLKELYDDDALTHPVRFIFQPAEETQPGGGAAVIQAGVLDAVDRAVALHCEPSLNSGQVGVRVGALTSTSDAVKVTVSSHGGHTSRPHLTGDVVFALGELITQVPAILGRRIDPRSGVNLTWGSVKAGNSKNAIPSSGWVAGTMRCLDVRVWEQAGELFDSAVRAVVAPFGVDVEIDRIAGVPPVVNDPQVTANIEDAARLVVGAENVIQVEQSLGGEDFGWYCRHVPAAMARLGTGTPDGVRFDLHQGDLVIDEGAIRVGVELLSVLAAGEDLG